MPVNRSEASRCQEGTRALTEQRCGLQVTGKTGATDVVAAAGLGTLSLFSPSRLLYLARSLAPLIHRKNA